MTPSLRGRLFFVSGLLVLFIFWGISSLLADSSLLIPSPLTTFQAMRTILLSPENYLHIAYTFGRLFGGLLLSALPGITLGIAAGKHPSLFAFFQPIILFFQSIPAIVWMLLLLLWLPKEVSPLFLVFLTTFPIWFLNTRQAILSSPTALKEMADVFAIKGFRRLVALYLPSLVLSFFTSLRATISLSLKVVVMAEVLAFPREGMGSKLFWAKTYVNTEELFAWAGLLFLFGWLIDNFIISFLSQLKNHFALEEV
ncbi:MAG: ABC transporter permease [Brevinematales bacterium]